ncbi:hypothetical protein O1611_g7907 [Lasiodiplodia mahajangana]|uniref:Uncharacterized protein n=1 Tax=Lasiodiplodia mahajangana TaxID=1108764 RepID=A0ACC2JE30_9PEZI|nr:hypothetical protein O1611_g7907 [Lasiodiplodia mahajangana]
MWLWTADHDIDDNNITQISVYVARGMLIESVKPLWLYGTASEHSVFYQYEFYQAQNVLAAMIQTESPYYQPNPLPPTPFTDAVGVFPSDPDYDCPDGKQEGCDASWAVRMVSSSNITVAGAGLYSWFQTYAQTCVDTQNCQLSLVQMQDNSGDIHFWNLITIGALNMISSDARDSHIEISALNYTNVDYHPFWSQLSLFEPAEVPEDGGDGGNLIYVDTAIWSLGGGATASCIPPCTLVLPPSQISSTTTISWPPLITTLLSSEAGGGIQTITTTFSIPAITTTAIDWWPVTVNSGDPTAAVLTPVQSVKPSPIQITLPPNVATLPPSQIPEYSNGVPISSSSSTTTTTTTVVPIFFPTPHPVTIQPQATVSISLSTKKPITTTLPPSTTTFDSTTITIPPITTTEIRPAMSDAERTTATNSAAAEAVVFSVAMAAALSLAVAEVAAYSDAALAVRPFLDVLQGMCVLLTNAAALGARMEAAESSLKGITNCHSYIDCDATDKTITSTQTEPEPTYGTVTVTVSDRVGDLTRFAAMPTGGGKTVPTGPNGEEATYWTWFVSASTTSGAYGLGTYNGRPSDECTNTGEWSDMLYTSSVWIYDVQGLTVFGDSSCSYTATNHDQSPPTDAILGTITCSKWQDATCYQDNRQAAQTCSSGRIDFTTS